MEINGAAEPRPVVKLDKPKDSTQSLCGYCAKPRNLNIVELMCGSCYHWHHESCISYQLGKLVPFMMNYVFVCKNCSNTGLETFKKNQAQFFQMCVTALANLQQTSVKDGKERTMFSMNRDIIPFIDIHWEGMTSMARRVTQSWHATIHKTLVKDIGTWFSCEEAPLDGRTSLDHPLFGLKSLELLQIRPNYEAGVKVKTTENTGNVFKSRGAKRKVPDQYTSASKKSRADVSAAKLHGYPLEHPFNKDGYRYILAEPDSHAPFRQEFDESNDWAGKPIPGWLYRTLRPPSALLALHDRAPQLKVSETRLRLTGEKGYSMIRATHSINRGVWYWECKINDQPEGSHARLGWSQGLANLQAPLGYDKFGYSWRSRKGTIFHESRGRHYSDGYSLGDILGFLIILPEKSDEDYLPPTYKDRPLVKFKSHLYYEEKDSVSEALKLLEPHKGSEIVFFKNGVCLGSAYRDIYCGSYYPTVSLYKNMTVTLNFGPKFKHPPKAFNFRGMNERAEELIVEQTMADMLFLTENEGKLRLDNHMS